MMPMRNQRLWVNMSNEPTSPAPDWEHWLKQHATRSQEEFHLEKLAPGDQLRVVTKNTIYDFVMGEGRDGILKTNRPDRPQGLARIMGCTFGLSSTIKPDYLFCGGSLEFTFQNGKFIHNTSPITAIYWLRVDPPAEPGADTSPPAPEKPPGTA